MPAGSLSTCLPPPCTEPGPIDIALLVGAGERHGAAATAWSYGLLGKRFWDPDGRLVRNYTRPRRFDLPGDGRRRLYRADFADQHALSRDLAVPVRTYFGVDSRVATTLLAGLTWIPGASQAPQGLHLPGTDRWLALARAAGGIGRVEERLGRMVPSTGTTRLGWFDWGGNGQGPSP